MPDANRKIHIFKSSYLQIAGVLLLILLAALLLWFTNANSTQALNAMVAQVRYYG